MKQVKLSDVKETTPETDRVDHSEPVRVGDILSDMFKTFGANFVSFAIIGVLMFVPLVAWAVLFAGGIGALQGDFATYGWTTFFMASVGSIIVGQIGPAFIVCGAVDYQAKGNQMALVAMLGKGLSRLIPVILCAILVAVITSIGYLLLIIPGLILAMALSVSIPAVVIENKGPIAALERSIELTKGSRWQVFGAIILLGIISFLLGLAVQAVTVALATGGDTGGTVTAAILHLVQMGITTALGGALSASLYVHLRENKEGTSADEIAQVFA